MGNPNLPQNPTLLAPTQPINGTSEVETITFGGTITGGSFVLRYGNQNTGPIAWSSTNATLINNIQTALQSLGSVRSGGVLVAAGGGLVAGIGPVTVTFQNQLGVLAMSPITVASNGLTGTSPTVVVSVTTPGVTADGRQSKQGQLCVAADTGVLWVNRSAMTQPTPNWVRESTLP